VGDARRQLRERDCIDDANGGDCGSVLAGCGRCDGAAGPGQGHPDGDEDDQATVDAALKQFADTGKKLPTLFPESIKGKTFDGDYQPTDKIWTDKAGFDEHITSFAKTVSEAKITDLDTLKATLPVIGKQCGGCHETYRMKKT
jgi:hypothetical protein